MFAGARGVESTFLVYEDERWTFDQTMSHVDALASALVSTFGITKGDRVGIAMRNLPEWIVSFAAILSIGAVSVSLNAWWTEAEVDYAIEDSGLSLLIADPERIERAHAPAHARGIPMVVVRADETRTGTDRRPALRRGRHAGRRRCRRSRWVRTTTPPSSTPRERPGFPKGAVSTHRAVTQALMAFWASATIQTARQGRGPPRPGGRRSPCFILIVPLFHVTGCVPVMLSCFGMKLKLVMMHRWDPEDALRLIEAEKVTAFVGVPTQSWDLLESPAFSKYDTSSLATIGGGGAPGPGQAGRPGREGFHPGPPQHRLRDDRDQRLRPGQQRRRLRHATRPRPGGPGPPSWTSRSATRTGTRCRQGPAARSG